MNNPGFKKTTETYQGFEQGSIRPPSEANSLLIRITRNCPWNHCTFCPVYKGAKFSFRPVEHIKKDIDAVHKYVESLCKIIDESGHVNCDEINKIGGNTKPDEIPALNAAYHWLAGGLSSIFIQDANSLIIKPSDLVDILVHLKKRFPWVERITSYARSHTIARISDADMKAIGDAGLNRIHIGLESGSDDVLKTVKKGVTKETHIKAGLKVKHAGIELSEYVMPGLGGQALSRVHALETADAINRINPDFIRLRSLAIPESVELHKEFAEGRFQPCTDRMKAEELLLFIENLNDITSTLKSDHILNLFEEVEGKFPDDKERILTALQTFLSMTPEQQVLFQVGRRMGIFSRLTDLEEPLLKAKAEQACLQYGITPDNVDEAIDDIMKRFI